MRKSLLFLLVLGLISLGCSSNNKAATKDNNAKQANSDSSADNSLPNGHSSPVNGNSDQSFVQDAIQGNRAEITLGKLVVSKTKNPSVKQFAQMMVKDHTQALSQLQQLAQQKNIQVPEGLPPDAQQLQSKLESATGKQFDKDYIAGMVQDHQKDVKDFQEASQSAKDPDVKQLATQLTPTLERHLQKAQQIDQKLGGSASSGSGL